MIALVLVLVSLLGIDGESIIVSFTSNAPSGDLTLTGTLDLPDTPPPSGKFPAVVIIVGSGIGEQSGTEAYNLPNYLLSPPPALPSCGLTGLLLTCYASLASSLSARGIAVLRYNKRSCVKETNVPGCTYPLCPLNQTSPPPDCLDLHKLTPNDLATDAANAVLFLRASHSDIIDPARISLIGHSEGSSVAPYAASIAGGVKSIVQLMGVGVDLPTVLREQTTNNGRLYQYGYQICIKTGGDPRIINFMFQNVIGNQDMKKQVDTIMPAILNGSLSDETLVNMGGLQSVGYIRVGLQWADINELFRIRSLLAPTTPILTINSPSDLQVWPAFYQPLHSVTMALPNTKSLIIDGLAHPLIPSDLSTDKIPEVLLQSISDWISQ